MTGKRSKRIHLALIAGGTSAEREVSLAGAREVARALDRPPYRVRRYDPATDLAALAADAGSIDVAFILLHGMGGEDGTIQGFLEMLGIPYQGSGVLGSALAMDKHLAKTLYRLEGLPVAPWAMATQSDIAAPDRLLANLGLPLVIKPLRQGSSIGMGLVHRSEELAPALEAAFAHDSEVMVEKYIAGREITVGVIGNDDLVALPLVEVIPDSRFAFFDYQAKYEPGATLEICPAEVDEQVRQQAQEFGIRAHKALRLRGYSRTDMIIGPQGLCLLETNTIPGMTPTSLLPRAAAEYGLDFGGLLDRLVALALERKSG